MGPLRLAAATLRDQSFDVTPAIPAAVAGPLADWLDSIALTWETAATLNPEVLPYLTATDGHPRRVAEAINDTLHG